MALLVKVDGTVTPVHPLDPSKGFGLRELQGFVGGYIEQVQFSSSTIFNLKDGSPSQSIIGFFCNEMGKLERLPLNNLASAYWKLADDDVRDNLLGDVIFITEDEDKKMREGDEEN